ncbi:MAG: AAA family ATPase [Caldisericaceae bacterium]
MKENEVDFEKEAFLRILPEDIKNKLVEIGGFESLIEVVLDLGRYPEARYTDKTIYLREEPVTREEINETLNKIGVFDRDHRAGIEKTLHRISGIFNRKGEVIGLTCRVGRAIYGTIDPLKDIIVSDKNILLLGKPGVGKTTLLRETARVLSTELKKRVIVIDTSNEIGGDGDIPHPGIGSARRMQVQTGVPQEEVMIEAVENHFPEAIIIDEIGRIEEAKACRTIAERGVRLIATAHGNSIENLMVNPTLQDLIGGITSVTLSDEEAIRRGTQKTVLERKSPPTFDVLIEIRERGVYAIYNDVAETVDAILRGFPVFPEIRKASDEIKPKKETAENFENTLKNREEKQELKIFVLGINSSYVERAIHAVRIGGKIVKDLEKANLILCDKKSLEKRKDLLEYASNLGIKIKVLEKTSLSGIKEFLKKSFKVKKNEKVINFTDIENLVEEITASGVSKELEGEEEDLKEIADFIEKFGLVTELVGLKPHLRLLIYPRRK